MPKTRKKSAKSKLKTSAKTSKKKSLKTKATKSAKKSPQKTPKKKTITRKTKVSPIPKDHSTVSTYLVVNGADKAIRFYQKIFGAKELMRLENAGRVSHAQLKIGNVMLMVADEWPEMNIHAPQPGISSPMTLLIYVKDADATVQQASNAGAKISRPVQEMFHGDRVGTVIDPFGHQWSIATRVKEMTKAELKKRYETMLKSLQAKQDEKRSNAIVEEGELENTGEFERFERD